VRAKAKQHNAIIGCDAGGMPSVFYGQRGFPARGTRVRITAGVVQGAPFAPGPSVSGPAEGVPEAGARQKRPTFSARMHSGHARCEARRACSVRTGRALRSILDNTAVQPRATPSAPSVCDRLACRVRGNR